MKHFYSFFRGNILAGVLVTVPFALTIFVLFKLGSWIIGLVSAAPNRFIGSLLDQLNPLVSQTILFVIGLVGTLLVVLIIGAIARNILGRKLVEFGEYLINKIPLARTIYTATKQIIETIMGRGGMKNLKRVAMFEYPRKGIYSIGFITSTIEDGQHHNLSGRRLVSIFVPTTPNPTSGYYIMLPEEDIKELSISVEDAFRIIMSAGLATNNIEDAGQSKKDT
ncbi:MAG: DUF502 domain-containing protein [Candidatus Dadabacteria bacterium]|nr:DUF502 domain-containing protein [Candidatus Dadabacteria bacterium]MCZ6527216.1 DUF502 domain-containing protein [Candidatus Dadabacteria bacterium]MCZ6555409.1 DUF502 domain-containing protein [Candidatus Dadabacteria bacterium]MCZ6638996.1 DUF502 domain-containing protein [Candidatus Dadabacteria bacterium]MCZ6685428.1 DUF502 domain-containing protein [Candidatus Dadabacteria bacterium]